MEQKLVDLLRAAFQAGEDYSLGSWDCDGYSTYPVEDKNNDNPNVEVWLKNISSTDEFKNLVETLVENEHN